MTICEIYVMQGDFLMELSLGEGGDQHGRVNGKVVDILIINMYLLCKI